jgi:hypothetical protein
MPRADFTKLVTKDEQGGSDVLDRHIRHVEDAFNRLGDVPSNDRIQTVTFKAGQTITVAHGLGYPVKFFDQSMHSGPALVRPAPVQPLDQTKHIALVADSDVTVTLRFS